MDKRNFISYVRQELEKALQTDGITIKQAESIVDAVFGSVVDIIASGDDVRYKDFGNFHPKLVQKAGQLINVKIGFSSFTRTNRELLTRFDHASLFQREENPTVKIFSSGESFRFLDPRTGQELFNLSEIARMAGVSLPTACKYAGQYKDQLPIVDNETGKKYPKEVAQIFRAIKERNTRHLNVVESPGEIKAGDLKGEDGTYTISEISRIVKISLPTLYKYLDRYSESIPSVTDRTGKKRYPVEAIEIFREIKKRNIQNWGIKRSKESVAAIAVEIRSRTGADEPASASN